MDRRYQVFISSTFQDLVEERKAIMEGLLKIDCLPAGMELFPAADDDQWTLIKGVIDQCDYYLIVSARRYGSVDSEGVSYTEKEYDYAVEQGIPVIGFLPKNPGSIPGDKIESGDHALAKLKAFQTKIKSRMVSFYESPSDLQANVIVGVTKLQKSKERPGWVRGDQAMTAETRAEIAELKETIALYEKQDAVSTSHEIDETFAHGSEQIDLDVTHQGYSFGSQEEVGTLEYSWDEIIEVLGPFMLDEAPERALRETLNSHLLLDILDEESGWTTTWSHDKAVISDKSWGSIIVQLRALRLIANGSKKRTVSDRAVYWKLTPAGDDYLVSLRAIPHDPNHTAGKA